METIWNQIADSDVFIGDLSHIVELENGSQVSNPNVMYEAGIAKALLGENRTILLASKESDINKLAFDINHRRISTFSINNKEFYKELTEWIDCAIIDATNQRFNLQYLVKDLLYEMNVLYNNLFRFIYGTEILEYPLNYNQVTREEICEKLISNVFDVLQVKTDYSETIAKMEKNINLFYPSGNRFLIFNAIKLFNALREYQTINELTNYEQFECLGVDNDCVYSFIDCQSFFLKCIENYDDLNNELYLRGNLLFLSKISPVTLPLFNVFNKSGITKALQECDLKVEKNMTIGYVSKYKFKSEATVDEYAKRIVIMLAAMNNILDYLKLETCNQNKEDGAIKALIHFCTCQG